MCRNITVNAYGLAKYRLAQMLEFSTRLVATNRCYLLGGFISRKFKNNKMESYKGYELFSDAAYYDMICIRKAGTRDFNDTIHVSTLQEAKQTVDEITALSDYMD